MKNCNNCARLKFNYDGKIFRCGRNCEKTFDNPKMHGLFCKHYAKGVIKSDKANR